jgi:hypothetical protein
MGVEDGICMSRRRVEEDVGNLKWAWVLLRVVDVTMEF